MTLEKLVYMVNQIDQFFSATGSEQTAVDGIADHLKKFWSPAMRQMLIDGRQEISNDLSERGRQAIESLAKSQNKV